MYYLSIAAIFREENSWLDEWILYHHALGVEHFVLYNDDPDTHVSDRILKPYVDQGVVENIHIRERSATIKDDIGSRQHDTYRDAIRNLAGQTHWLAIIDIDEFILPRCRNDIRETLEEYEEHNGLAINWAIYGSSGHVTRPPTQINHFRHRSKTNWEPNQFVKSIVKPDRVLLNEPHHVHYFPTRDGATVNENHEPVTGMTHAISTEKIRINNYDVRSWQEFWENKVRRHRLCNVAACDGDYFERHDRNEIFDGEISRRFGHIIRDVE